MFIPFRSTPSTPEMEGSMVGEIGLEVVVHGVHFPGAQGHHQGILGVVAAHRHAAYRQGRGPCRSPPTAS